MRICYRLVVTTNLLSIGGFHTEPDNEGYKILFFIGNREILISAEILLNVFPATYDLCCSKG